MDNMTALVSCFARAYHYRNSNLPVFADHVAEKMTKRDYGNTKAAASGDEPRGFRSAVSGAWRPRHYAALPLCL